MTRPPSDSIALGEASGASVPPPRRAQATDTSETPVVPADPPAGTPGRPATIFGWYGGSLFAGTAAWLLCMCNAILLTYFAHLLKPTPTSWKVLVGAWGQWDWGFYRIIATDGYDGMYTPEDTRIGAFFPLYGLLVRWFDWVVPGPPVFAGLVVSSLALLGTLVMLHRTVSHEFDGRTANRTMAVLAAFPTAFFLVAPYPSGLILFFSVTCFYALRTGHWWVAGVFAALASGTRASGVLLAVPFAYEYLRQHEFKLRRFRWDVLAIGLVPAGLVAYAAYTQHAYGDALLFSHAQANWGRHFAGPWVSIWHTIQGLVHTPISVNQVNVLNLGAVLLVGALLVLSLVGPWKLPRHLLAVPLLGITQWLFIVSFPGWPEPTGRLPSASRHVLEIFPAFILLARIAQLRHFAYAYFYLALAVQGAITIHYLNGGWIA
ncbi:hypothetical protein GCM10010399_86370 [Dactylosporangium fulvum]|uniref:Integral membrane protein n=1 Tax=Dactylosporangium fulvum TaxID=53359 RepID=A0ABY5VYP2_9ACTN|nr:hypothetical protein [Dactylosporangium fulvum]UWP82159.1 hypothetical protein Dfulv_45035 [Dactylosporangium fulvum]